jgi:hypothetical protein
MLLLCGIEQADAQLGGLCASVQRLLESGMGGAAGEGGSSGEKLAPTLRRAAVRLLHCLASAAEILDQVPCTPRTASLTPSPLHPLAPFTPSPPSPPHPLHPLAPSHAHPLAPLTPLTPVTPQNILVEFVVLHDLAPSLRPLLLAPPPSSGGGKEGTAGACPAAEEGMQEDVLRLVVILAAYGGHEAKNGFRRRHMLRAWAPLPSLAIEA